MYFHLNLRADDDGFIGNPKRITRNIGANEDDLKLLIAKRFVLAFDDGVIVIKHWRMHNAIKKDRYTKTNFLDDLNMLHIKENGSYTFDDIDEIEDSENPVTKPVSEDTNNNGTQMENKRNTNGEQTEHKNSTGLGIDKIRLEEDRLDKNNSTEPKQVDSVQYADVEKIPLSDGTEWQMPLELYQEYSRIYPSVNVKTAVANMRIWSISNPTKKKTRRGITRFVNSWLEREQNNPRKRSNNTNSNTGSAFDTFEI